MRIQQLKLVLIGEGFFISELSSIPGFIDVSLFKNDIDALRFQQMMRMPLNVFLSEVSYIDLIEQAADKIRKIMKDRESQNIGTCNHRYIVVNNVKVCTQCRGKFGQLIQLNMGVN